MMNAQAFRGPSILPCWTTGSVCKQASVLMLAFMVGACSQAPDQQRQLYAFGTVVTLRFSGASSDQIGAAVSALERKYAILDVDWYPWVKPGLTLGGKLFALNAGIANGQTLEVDPALARLIRRASEIEQLSAGRFNAATGSLTRLWGLVDPSAPPNTLPNPASIQYLLDTGMDTRLLHWEGNTLSSSSRSIELDLGGIAKGAILKLSVDILQQHGIRNAIVDIGGDLRVVGSIEGRAARIGIRSPAGNGTVGWLEVHDGETVVTSGNYERYFELEGHRYQHILDPRNGYPVQHTASVTVVHRDSLLADAAATALMVGGMAEFEEICRQLGIVDALLIGPAGDLRLTPSMQKRVNWSK